MNKPNYVIGVDFGTDSVRSILVDSSNGEEISSSVTSYSRWQQGEFCDSSQNLFRQHPLDHIEGLEQTVTETLADAPKDAREKVVGISIDATGSTPGPVDREGTPLALLPGFENNPNAMFMLWKDHTAVQEAEEINQTARNWGGIDYTQYSGGVYSSEWFWAKMLHILREDEKVREAAFSWVEHCDWLSAFLTGKTNPLTIKRSRCAAGHKAMWHDSFDGLPSEDFLITVDPLFKGIRARLYRDTHTCDCRAGTLSAEWAQRLNLSEKVSVGVGAIDAHLGAVGAQIEPYVLCKVIGTSTCDMLVAPIKDVGDKLVKGICGQVDGSIIPGLIGMEAGQSAFGDIFSWFKEVLLFPVKHILSETALVDSTISTKLLEEITEKLIPALAHRAEEEPLAESGVLALDWLNGRRTPFANQRLRGAITGLNLGSKPSQIFRALVEATAFGAKKIVDRFVDEGIPIKGIIALGGIPQKSPFIIQVLSDVLDVPIRVARSEQTCALGAAMAAATVSGIYATIENAQRAMGSGFEKEYKPNPETTKQYKLLYEKYSKLGAFIESELT